MARTSAAKAAKANEDEEQAALAVVGSDELADVLGDFDYDIDGLDEVGAEDVKIALKLYNISGKKGDVVLRPDQFWDTVDEKQQDELDLVLVDLMKSNLWYEFDESEQRNVNVCRSDDRVTGVMQMTKGPLLEGQERKCKSCPNSVWKTGANGKKTRDCGPVYDVLAVENGIPCILRFKRMTLKPIRAYLNKHHIGKRVVSGQRRDYPLFAFGARVRLELDDGGKYALPVIERGDVLTRAEMDQHYETAKVWREQFAAHFRAAADGANADVDPNESSGAPAVTSDEFADPKPNASGDLRF